MKIKNPKKRTVLSHISNLITFARLDGEISEEEKQLIFRIADKAGLTEEEFQQCVQDSNVFTVDIPRTDEEKRQYLKNVLSVIMADGKITEEESKLAFELGRRFFGDSGVDIVKEVYNEILAEMQESSNDSKTMSQEEIREDVKKRIQEGLIWLKQNEMSNAFDILFPAAIVDETGRMLFNRIFLPVNPVFQLNQRQVNDLKGLADKGYPFAQLSIGRYYMLVRPEKDSLQLAQQYLEAAYNAGMPDALCFLGVLVRDGFLGLADEKKYLEMRNEAYKKGSFKALEMIAKDLIHGYYGEAQPQEVLEDLLETVIDEQGEWIEDPLTVEPAVYDLIGAAYEKLDDKENAEKAYLQAAEMGCLEGFDHFIMMRFFDAEGKIIDAERYAHYIEIGCDFNSALCHTLRGDMEQEVYDALPVLLKPRVTSWMQRDLLEAYKLGDNIAPYYMGHHFYYGNFGFEEDNELAWKWFQRGAAYGSAYCYSMLAQMIEEEFCPDEEAAKDEEFLYFCKLMSLRLGNEKMLIPVVKASREGFLADYAKEILDYYEPKVNEEDLIDEDDEEEYDEQDGKYDAWA